MQKLISIDMLENEIDTKAFDGQSPVNKGVKIQARCFNVYNPTIPARDDVRRQNYTRRKEQLTGMGFKTPLNVPYKIIGEPLILDHKLISLHGFGPYPSKNKETRNQDFQNKNANIHLINANIRNSATQQNFFLRNYKKNKQLLTLQSEVNRTRNYLHRVKLGHSFFDLIKKEEEERIKKSNAESKSIQMSIRPMVDSDEEFDQDSEVELIDEQNKNSYADSVEDSEARSNMATPYNSENNPSALYQYKNVSREGINESVSSIRPQTHPANNVNYRLSTRPFTVPTKKSASVLNSYRNQKTSIKKHKEEVTPYTPIYSSLLSKDEGFILDKNSLTRQLCVLLWLLESINVESVGSIKPLRSCFSVKNIGGDRNNERNFNYLDEIERKWRKFEKMDDKRNKYRRSKPNYAIDQSVQDDQLNIEITNDEDTDVKDASKYIEEISALNDSSVTEEDINKSQTNKQSLADLTLTLMNMPDSEREKLSGPTSETRDLKKDSVNIASSEAKKMNAQKQTESLVKKSEKPKIQLQKKTAQKKDEIDKIPTMPEHDLELIKIGKLEEMEKVFNKTTTSHERRNSKSLKAFNGPIHALWTDKVLDYQNRISTQDKYNKLMELKEQFENFIEEDSVDVNNRIEEIQKKRMTICSLKYVNMNLKERGIHNLLQRMNQKVEEYYKFEDLKNTPEPKYYDWYIDLESLIEKYYNRYDAILGRLLDKLSYYGKLSSKKQNEKVFFKVLKSLRIWELISPDVMSPVEFCRDKILEIQVEEFEKWFKLNHPDYFVSRQNHPSSAPPVLDNEQN